MGATSIPVASVTVNAAYAVGSSVYDSSSELPDIEAIGLSLQATKNPGGQPTGYQSLAYILSPTYNAIVG